MLVGRVQDIAKAANACDIDIGRTRMPRMYLGLIFLAYLCLTSFGSGLEKIFDASDRSLALLGPKSSCIKEAVQELLPECETGDLDVDQRVAICHKEITIRCAQVLETRAQWWTTYSGYYQSIGQICFQYQKEHETERVLQLYRNINSVESQLYSHLVDALARLDLELAHSNETKYYFEEIGRQFEAINAISSEVMATYNNFMDRSLEKFNQLERLSDKVVQKSESVVERHFRDLDQKLLITLETVSSSLEQLKLADKQIGNQSVSLKCNGDLIQGLSIQQSQLIPLQTSNHELASKLTSLLQYSHYLTNSTISSQNFLMEEIESQFSTITSSPIYNITQTIFSVKYFFLLITSVLLIISYLHTKSWKIACILFVSVLTLKLNLPTICLISIIPIILIPHLKKPPKLTTKSVSLEMYY